MEKRADFFRRPPAGVVHKMGVAPRHGRCRVAEQVGYGQFPFPGKRQPAGVGGRSVWKTTRWRRSSTPSFRPSAATARSKLLLFSRGGKKAALPSARSAAEAPRKRGGVRNAHSRTAHAVIAG